MTNKNLRAIITKMQISRDRVILFFILLLAFLIRIYKLDSIPPSPYLDEVSNGYNAYSLMMTGRDEYGRFLPLLLQAYNDFRPAVYVYFMIPFIKLFGLSVFAIRLPVVLLSVLTTGAIYFLVREMFSYQFSKPKTDKLKTGKLKSDNRKLRTDNWLPHAAAFFYAISPWSIYSSRLSDEINMSLSFFVFGMALFFYFLNHRKHGWKTSVSLVFSVVSFVIAFYAYHGIKFFLPFFLVTLLVLFFREIFENKRLAILAGSIGIVLLIPLYMAFQAPGATVRLGAVDAVSQRPEIVALSSKRLVYDTQQHAYLGKLFDNRRFLLGVEFVKNSLRNLDVTWLFLGRENKTFRVSDIGPMYFFALPFIFFSIVFLARETYISWKVKILLLLWILFSTIPSGMSSESPHLNRTNTMLPALIILQAIGLVWIIHLLHKYLKKPSILYTSYSILAILVVGSFLWFLHVYFVLSPYTHGKEYQYGTMQAMAYAKEHEGKYQRIVVSNQANLTEGYMYYLFATRYDPALYQKQGGTKSAFFTDEHFIGKYHFIHPGHVKFDKQDAITKILFITNPSELDASINKQYETNIKKKFSLPNGDDSVWVLEGKVK
jgi:4-amino-4-deoxy-L-arabinose transferase-like glycosyltransferase